MKQYILIAVTLMISLNARSQVNGSYLYLTFDEFLKFNTEAPINYLKSVYKNIKYPNAMKEKEQEDIVRVTLINHGKDSLDMIISGTIHQEFIDTVKNVITSINSNQLIPTDIKYITEFYVDFDLAPWNTSKCDTVVKYCNIIDIKAFRPLKYHGCVWTTGSVVTSKKRKKRRIKRFFNRIANNFNM